MNVIRENINNISSANFDIGFVGEKNHTRVIINCAPIFHSNPNAVATMVAKPPVGDIYPVNLTRDGKNIIWDVSESDIARSGSGEYQITFTDGSGETAEVIKTVIGSYSIKESMVAEGEPPEPIEDWLEEANEALADLRSFENVTVTGSTPSITGEENKRYVCGEVTSISISAPESGMIDVTFTSGSTPATLTTTGITFPVWFDGTLNANTRYEINVLDGYGVITAWQTI